MNLYINEFKLCAYQKNYQENVSFEISQLEKVSLDFHYQFSFVDCCKLQILSRED